MERNYVTVTVCIRSYWHAAGTAAGRRCLDALIGVSSSFNGSGRRLDQRAYVRTTLVRHRDALVQLASRQTAPAYSNSQSSNGVLSKDLRQLQAE